MQLSVSNDGDVRTVAVTGELDLGSSDKLVECAESALGDGKCAALMLDLSGVTFLDCSGLSALLQIAKESERLDVPFEILKVPSSVLRLLEVTELEKALPVS